MKNLARYLLGTALMGVLAGCFYYPSGYVRGDGYYPGGYAIDDGYYRYDYYAPPVSGYPFYRPWCCAYGPSLGLGFYFHDYPSRGHWHGHSYGHDHDHGHRSRSVHHGGSHDRGSHHH
ncbi:MAG TPA: hypothetical protein VFG55_06250 [Rhodanobacteraceae bacterium]|nr:hypothetical protein [Rhodanobacteraceae bacterium]